MPAFADSSCNPRSLVLLFFRLVIFFIEVYYAMTNFTLLLPLAAFY
jgi:hypothetical protein